MSLSRSICRNKKGLFTSVSLISLPIADVVDSGCSSISFNGLEISNELTSVLVFLFALISAVQYNSLLQFILLAVSCLVAVSVGDCFQINHRSLVVFSSCQEESLMSNASRRASLYSNTTSQAIALKHLVNIRSTTSEQKRLPSNVILYPFTSVCVSVNFFEATLCLHVLL